MLRRALSLFLVLSACGSVSLLDNNLPPPPTITSFTANPAEFGADGGSSTLSWTVVNQDNLGLEPGNHDVTGFTSADVNVLVTTTYTLSASNSLGQTSSSVTVIVGLP